MFLATKSALKQLEDSLQCSVCHNLLTEPCTLGNCPHLLCKACAGNYTGNACPSCHAPAWAKDLQIKRELGMVVRLCRRLDRLINSDQQDTASIELSEYPGHGLMKENGGSYGSGDGIDVVLNKANALEGSETEPMSISESDVEGFKPPAVARKVFRPVQRLDAKSASGLTKGKTGKQVEKKDGKSLSKNSEVVAKCGASTNNDDNKQTEVVNKQIRKLLSLNANPLMVYDFEASPPRPKTRKAKVQVTQQTKREARLKKVAAANKKWDSVSSHSRSRKEGRKHVSFSDDSLKSGSSSTDDSGPSSTRGQQTSHAPKTTSKASTNTTTTVKAVKNTPDNESISRKSPPRDRQNNGSTSGVKQINKTPPKDSKNKKGRKARMLPKDPSPSEIDNNSTESSPRLAKLGQKRRSSDSPAGSSNNNDASTPSGSEKRRKSVEQSTPESSTRRSPGQKKRLSGGRSGISPSPNSSFSSPKNALMKRNKRGETPLHVACIKGDEKEVKSLLEQGADPNSKDNAGWTPLHEACNHGHTALLSLLLDHNALINAPGFEHDTPLHDAVNNNRIPVIKFLRERGASLQTRNIHGQTPLDLPATPAIKKALLTQPLSSEVTNSPICTPVTAPWQHLQDRQVVLLATGMKPKEKTALQKCSDLLDGRVVDEFTTDVTHLVAACEEDGLCLRTMKYMQAVLAGRWVVSFKWIEQCIKHKDRVEEVEFEIPGTSADPESNTARRARENIQKQFPGLFSGCHFFFSGTFKHPTPSKAELTELIKLGGGTILVRQPRPDDDVIQASTVVPYHAQTQSQCASCAYYVIYDHLGKRAPPTVRTAKVCTVPVYWLLDCVSQFMILDPPRE